MKKSRMKKLVLSSLLAMTAAIGFSGAVFADGETLEDVFTNDDLRECVVSALQAIDSEISGATKVEDVDLTALTDLTCTGHTTLTDAVGIETLTGLTSLNLSDNKITAIDLSKNTALTDLNLSKNQIATIDLTKNTLLTTVDLSNNFLTTLDLVQNAALSALDVANNGTLTVYLSEDAPIAEVDIIADDETIFHRGTLEDEDNDEDGGDEENLETETKACESWDIDDETIAIFKGMLAAYGYDTSKYDATAVKLAAAQTNMCDGMSVAEARTLMNAMGVTDLSDAELEAIAEMVTKAYNAINDGATLEDVFKLTAATGPLVPNTGVATGDFNANVVVMSFGAVVVMAGVLYGVRYGMKRKEARVTFRR